jgi:hypothetical protein
MYVCVCVCVCVCVRYQAFKAAGVSTFKEYQDIKAAGASTLKEYQDILKAFIFTYIYIRICIDRESVCVFVCACL